MCTCCCSDKYKQFFLRLHRIILFLVVCFGIVCSGFTLGSCRLISYDAEFAPLPTIEADAPSPGTISRFGLFRYDPDGNGCRRFSWDDYLTAGGEEDVIVARSFCCLVMILSFSALMVVWVEYLCCRFCCGRLIASGLLVLGCISQGTVFLLFNTPLCRVEKREDDDLEEEDYPFPCDIDNGSYVAMAAMGTYLLAAMMVCATAKPEPVCKTLRESDENDPCICPRIRKKTEEDKPEGSGDEEDQAVDEEASWREDTNEKETNGIVVGPSREAKQLYPDQEQEKPYKGRHQDAEVVDNDLFFDTKSRRTLSFNFSVGSDLDSDPSPVQAEYSYGDKVGVEASPNVPSRAPPSAVRGVSLMVADSAS